MGVTQLTQLSQQYMQKPMEKPDEFPPGNSVGPTELAKHVGIAR